MLIFFIFENVENVEVVEAFDIIDIVDDKFNSNLFLNNFFLYLCM